MFVPSGELLRLEAGLPETMSAQERSKILHVGYQISKVIIVKIFSTVIKKIVVININIFFCIFSIAGIRKQFSLNIKNFFAKSQIRICKENYGKVTTIVMHYFQWI